MRRCGEDRGGFRLVEAGLQDRELVAAEAGDGIGVAHAGEEALGHRLEEAVADRMAERVVDALEVVEVEAEHGERLAARHPDERLLHLLAEEHAVREAGERVVARHVLDAGLGADRLGDVLDRRDPAAVDHRLVADLHRAAVLELEPIVARAALEGARQLLVAIGLELSRPGADREPVLEHGQDGSAGQGQLRRQLVELGVAPVADDDPALGVEHAEPLGHGVEGGVEAAVLLGERALGRLALGDVLVRRDPAAVRHRLEGDREGAAVDKLEEPRPRRAVLDRRDQVGGVLLGPALRVDAGREPMGEEIVVARAGLGQIGSEPVHLGVARVADDEPALAVEHAQAVGHVVEGGVEAQIVPRQLAVDLLQRRVGRGETLLRLALGGDVAADAAVAEEGAVGGKARLAADLEPAHAAVAMTVGIDEVPERPARQEIVDMGLPERPVGGVRGDVEAALADLAIGLDAGDLGETAREIGEAQIRVHLPEPIGRDLGEIFEQTFERHPEPLPDRPSRRDVPKKPVIWSWKAPVFSLRAPAPRRPPIRPRPSPAALRPRPRPPSGPRRAPPREPLSRPRAAR